MDSVDARTHRVKDYIRTDPFEELASSLELAGLFARKAMEDDRYWKWFVYAVHSAVQNTTVLVLNHGNGLLAQKPKVMERMLKAYELGTEPVAPHLDNFERLVEKVLHGKNLRGGTAPLRDEGHLPALRSLDQLRDEFSHFNLNAWSIEIKLIQDCAVKALDLVRYYAVTTDAVNWYDESMKIRVKRAADSVYRDVGVLFSQ